MEPFTVYTNGTCSKARSASKWLRDRGLPFSEHNYLLEPLSRDALQRLHAQLGVPAIGLVRTAEAAFAPYRNRPLDDDACLDLLTAHPELLQRPVVVHGDKAVIARPAERIADLVR